MIISIRILVGMRNFFRQKVQRKWKHILSWVIFFFFQKSCHLWDMGKKTHKMHFCISATTIVTWLCHEGALHTLPALLLANLVQIDLTQLHHFLPQFMLLSMLMIFLCLQLHTVESQFIFALVRFSFYSPSYFKE